MPRMRAIKPGFLHNELLAECEPLARVLFAGLWMFADREGRLEERRRRIKADCLPYDDCDVGALLDQLAARGFIERYAVDGVAVIQVVNFRKHQRPHKREAASTLPGPNGRGEAGPRTDPGDAEPGNGTVEAAWVMGNGNGEMENGDGGVGEGAHAPAASEALRASPRPGGAGGAGAPRPRAAARSAPHTGENGTRPKRGAGWRKERDGPAGRGWPAPTYTAGAVIDAPSAFELAAPAARQEAGP